MLSMCPITILAVCVLTQDATPVSELTVDHSRIPAKAKYKATMTSRTGQPVDMGTMTLETNVAGDVVLLSDSITMKGGPDGREGTGTIRAECEKDPLLTLRKAKANPPNFVGDPPSAIVVSDDKSLLVIKVEGRADREAAYPKGAVIGFAVFRIPSLLPQEEGKRYSIAGILDPEAKEDAGGEVVFVCQGKMTFERDGKAVECVKFTVDGSESRPPMEYYVDEKGALERIVIAERQILDLIEQDSTESREQTE